MTTDKVIYETGATSHAVNDLILFIDNTRQLVYLRDFIYKSCVIGKISLYNMHYQFLLDLLPIAREWYVTELGYCSSKHLFDISDLQKNEFATLFTNNFEHWKQEHNTKVS